MKQQYPKTGFGRRREDTHSSFQVWIEPEGRAARNSPDPGIGQRVREASNKGRVGWECESGVENEEGGGGGDGASTGLLLLRRRRSGYGAQVLPLTACRRLSARLSTCCCFLGPSARALPELPSRGAPCFSTLLPELTEQISSVWSVHNPVLEFRDAMRVCLRRSTVRLVFACHSAVFIST